MTKGSLTEPTGDAQTARPHAAPRETDRDTGALSQMDGREG